jgi:iron complex transport system ATP-binding protein
MIIIITSRSKIKRARVCSSTLKREERRLMEESLTKSGKADDPVLSVNIASLPRPGGGEMLAGIHFSAGKECLVIIGPNGSGKTSLLRAIDCQLPSREGDVRLYGRSIAALTRQQRARQIAVLAQNDTRPASGA